MNTANLQMEGLLLTLAALLDLLRRKGIASEAELDEVLAAAEQGVGAKPALSDSNEEAIRFPIRFLQRALLRGEAPLDFASLAGDVGRAPRRTEDENRRRTDDAGAPGVSGPSL